MTVLPEIEDCQMMKKPVIETNNIEKEAFDLAKADVSRVLVLTINIMEFNFLFDKSIFINLKSLLFFP